VFPHWWGGERGPTKRLEQRTGGCCYGVLRGGGTKVDTVVRMAGGQRLKQWGEKREKGIKKVRRRIKKLRGQTRKSCPVGREQRTKAPEKYRN